MKVQLYPCHNRHDPTYPLQKRKKTGFATGAQVGGTLGDTLDTGDRSSESRKSEKSCGACNVCVCQRAREREKEGGREGGSERE